MKKEKDKINKKENNDTSSNLSGEERLDNLSDDTDNVANDLQYDEKDESYEIDVESNAADYRHPDPYETGAKGGNDMDSDWDEANLTVNNEYDKDGAFTEEMEESAMHIDRGNIVELDPIDEALAETPEDKKEGLDEEGYPKNDSEGPA